MRDSRGFGLARDKALGPATHGGAPGEHVRLLRFPHPYRAMLAISSDIDRTSIHRLRGLFRYINTNEDTPVGPGLGIEFASSAWMFAQAPADRRIPAEISYWSDLSGGARSSFADEIVHYARVGWIDTLHSYGNFSSAREAPKRFTRRHAETAAEEMARVGFGFPVWTNHGGRNNRQNIGDEDYMLGDAPGSPAYHADVTCAAGVRFLWEHVEQGLTGKADPVRTASLGNGRPIHFFTRMTATAGDDEVARLARARGAIVKISSKGLQMTQLWAPHLLNHQLSGKVLDSLVDRGEFLVIAQHLGQQLNMPFPDGNVMQALQRLAAYQDDRRILTATSSRLLRYAINRKSARWRVVETGDGPLIDIEAIEDPVDGVRRPTLEDVHGFSFAAPRGARIAIAGRIVADADLARDQIGSSYVVGIPWRPLDRFDHTAEFRRRETTESRQTGYALEPGVTFDAGPGKAAVLARLELTRRETPTCEPQLRHAIDDAMVRYGVGLDHYAKIATLLGFTGRAFGLDVGSGAGHWTNAFALLNGRAVGVDLRPQCVAVANEAAAALKLGRRARFLVADAHALPFSKNAFDTAICHNALMHGEHDRVLAEINRTLRQRSPLYIAYGSTGMRLGLLAKAAVGEKISEKSVRGALHVLFGSALYRLGIFNTPHGRTRCYTTEELHSATVRAGFGILAEPGLADGPGPWRSYPGTIDFLAQKQRAPEEAARQDVDSSVSGRAIRQVVRETIKIGAPVLALLRLEAAGVDPRSRIWLEARLKAGRLMPDDPALRRLSNDPRWSARTLRAKIAFDQQRWPDVLRTLKSVPLNRATGPLGPPTRLYMGDTRQALHAANRLADAFSDDFACRLTLPYVLMESGDGDGFRRALGSFIDDLATGRIVDIDAARHRD